MAVLTCNFYSSCLGMGTTFLAVIPELVSEDIPTAYLLHGLSDDYTQWLRVTSAERYARQRGIALIMPCGGRSFYTDMVYGAKYYSYVTQELVAYTRQLFRLSHKREKTFIAGASMGGYGAMKAALSNPEQYGAVASLSGVMDVADFFSGNGSEGDGVPIWGVDFRTVLQAGSQNLFSLVDDLKEQTEKAPRIYQICGTEDFLYHANCRFRDYIQPLDFDYRYAEMPGAHDWGFWDSQLPSVLDFFLEKVQ